MIIQFDYLKFKDVVHLIAERCPQDKLGRVKLHKTLYFADMFSYVGSGRPLTGAVYRRQPRGPMAVALNRALSDLQRDGALEVRREEFFGFDKDVFEVRSAAPRSRLTAEEICFLDEIIRFTCHENSAQSISEISHTAAWEAVPNGSIMPYSQAYLMFASDDTSDAEEWAAQQEHEVEAGAGGWLEPEAVAAFRARVLAGRSTSPAPR